MKQFAKFTGALVLLSLTLLLAGCSLGPSASGTFERSLDVTPPIRLELSDTSADVTIRGSQDKKVHVRAQVQVSSLMFGSPEKRLAELIANPPIEQTGDTIRIGKDMARLHNVSITYAMEVPRDTEIDTTVVSGSQTVSGVRGPVKISAVSGTIHVDTIDRNTQLSTVSGAIDANNVNDDLHASTVSGAVSVTNVKGEVDIRAVSGSINVSNPSSRIDAGTISGAIDVNGAKSDVRAHAGSGRVGVAGNPLGNSFWDLKTGSGTVLIAVPHAANFHLSAEATSGEIRTDIPIVVEEQGKHTLRARMGNDGGRVEVHTASGEIQVRGTS